MTEKLFYQDAYIQSFSTKVLKQEMDGKDNWFVVLNKTAFYPTGGGQPHDLGRIENKNILNVEEINGEIRHYLDGPLNPINGDVSCKIDWQRRFDHMQQHAGQHILSAAFDHLFGYKTVGFHLGTEVVTIDLETENLTEEEVEKAEEFANRIILENKPIEVKWVSEQELSKYPLRKETKVKENIRLVIIPDFDYNGCGGTHPSSTGEVSAIKVLDWEKQRKNTRVQFVSGTRVIKQLDQKQKVLRNLTKLLNASEKEMKNAVKRILENTKKLEKANEQVGETLLEYEAKELLTTNENHLIYRVFQDRSIQELQKLARLIIEENQGAMVFFASENDQRLQLVCARGVGRTESMKEVIGTALPHINGKGGGNDSFAQGGGEKVISGERMLQHLIHSLSN